jgi:MarC family integral membrane protein
MDIRQRRIKSSNTDREVLLWNWGKTAAAVVAVFAAETPVAFAHGVATAEQARGAMSHWSLGEVFTFLFVALGPLNVIGPFATITHGRGPAFKRGVAFRAFLVATVALLFAATLGAKTLQAWGISVGALLLAAGAILFLVALQPVLAGYRCRRSVIRARAGVLATRFSNHHYAVRSRPPHPAVHSLSARFGRSGDFGDRSLRARAGLIGDAVHRPACEDPFHQAWAGCFGMCNGRSPDCAGRAGGGRRPSSVRRTKILNPMEE